MEPSYVPGLHPTPRDAPHVQPTHVPGLDLTPRGQGHGPYVENRLLTPSNQRHQEDVERREFGIQTGEPHLYQRQQSSQQSSLNDSLK